MSFPVVVLKAAKFESTAEAGPTTSPEPPPHPLYCGILSVSPMRVATQLVHIVVRVKSPCFASSCVCIELVTPST